MASKEDFQNRLKRLSPAAEPKSEHGAGPNPAPQQRLRRDLGFWSTFRSILGDILHDFAGPIAVLVCGGLVVVGVAVTFGVGLETALIATLVVLSVLAAIAVGSL